MASLLYIQAAAAGLPTQVLAGDKIYKDDCMYSFDNAENNSLGLDVCMSCFQAFARAPHHDFTLEHYSKKRHPLFLNIKKQLKPKIESDEGNSETESGDQKNRRKVAKLEIVAEKELDKYDISTSIYIAPLDDTTLIEACPENVQSLANGILSANLANVADEIKAWELEVFPCEHSRDILTQIDQKKPVNFGQCALCDLKENVWICLTCGSIGCGREQFGSDLKGNSHALTHFEASGHAVAVKLGSLSADSEDSCDCYCYQCNDEVKVPKLTDKLKPFGVDLSVTVKLEKNLVEMNLDTNKSWQFNLDGALGEKLVPVFGAGLTGMLNLGNSCYLNSVVQVLFSLESYQQYFKLLQFDKTIPDAAVDLPSQMIKLYDGLNSGRYSKPSALKGDEYQAGIKPSTFKALVGADHQEFKTNKQQDANEFMLYLFDKLDKQFGLALNEDFKFLLGSKVICLDCKHGSKKINLVDNISVPLLGNVMEMDAVGRKVYEESKLLESFKAFAAKEKVESFKCENCGSVNLTSKQEGFVSFPKTLAVSVQRIMLENWVPVKQDIPIEIPEQIDITSFKAPVFELGEFEIEPENVLQPKEFVPNAEALSMLLSMGFSELRCFRGLYHTGNKDAEEAMNWVFAHMNDSDIDSPFNPSAKISTGKSGTNSETEVSPDAIENLVSMGFSALLAKKALTLNKNDLNASVEWLFSNPNDEGIIEKTAKHTVNLQKETADLSARLQHDTTNKKGMYVLKAVICHKGTSPHTGHYVAFIKKNDDWLLFNDEKVVLCGGNLADIRKNGYIYFFNRL